MSRLYDSSSDYSRFRFNLDDSVDFDGPYGFRMRGKIVRVYNSSRNYHVEVAGERYEVDSVDDNMTHAN